MNCNCKTTGAMNKTLKTILIYVVIPIALSLAAVQVMWVVKTNQEKKEVKEKLSDFSERLDLLTGHFDWKAEQDSTKRDRLINEYVLRTYGLHQEVYRYTVEKRILDLDDDLYRDATQVMESIYNWQRLTESTRQNFLSGMGLADIYVIETSEYASLTDELTIKACKEVLKINPGNKQAEETLNNAYINQAKRSE